MIISSVKSLLDFSFVSLREKANMIGHVLVLFCCIFAVFASHLKNSTRSSKKGYVRKKHRLRNMQSSEYAFYTVLPFAVIFKNTYVFVGAAFVMSCLRVFFFKKAFKNLGKLEKVYGILMNLMWITYVSIFIVLIGMEETFLKSPLTLG